MPYLQGIQLMDVNLVTSAQKGPLLRLIVQLGCIAAVFVNLNPQIIAQLGTFVPQDQLIQVRRRALIPETTVRPVSRNRYRAPTVHTDLLETQWIPLILVSLVTLAFIATESDGSMQAGSASSVFSALKGVQYPMLHNTNVRPVTTVRLVLVSHYNAKMVFIKTRPEWEPAKPVRRDITVQ